MLKAAPAFALLNPAKGENLGPLFSFSTQFSRQGSVLTKNFPARDGNGGLVVYAKKETNNQPLTGILFEPFEEVKKELMLVPSAPQASLARHKFVDDCEAAINEQIKFVSQIFISPCSDIMGRVMTFDMFFLPFLWQCGIYCFVHIPCPVCLF